MTVHRYQSPVWIKDLAPSAKVRSHRTLEIADYHFRTGRLFARERVNLRVIEKAVRKLEFARGIYAELGDERRIIHADTALAEAKHNLSGLEQEHGE